MRTLQDQDNDIVARVRGLRNEMQVTVNTVRAARDQIAARKQELEATRRSSSSGPRARHGAAQAARDAEQVRKQQDDLEGDLSDISQKIAEQLGAAGPAASRPGPIRPGGHGLIWPVNGPIISGYRPAQIGAGYEFHEGDRHSGPDRDADSRRRVRDRDRSPGPTGGYGNYTCIDHGGGLSTCYAHQERILVSVGQQVAQAQVIGI